MQDVIDLTRSLVDIPSVTGDEQAVGIYLEGLLRQKGWDCRRQEVSALRFNLLATLGSPRILLTTHLDTVPPFFPFGEDESFVYGRGCCDAKGIAAAMICAGDRLREQGFTGLGLLFVVGEETDSAGAIRARELDLDCAFLVNGEPTDNVLAVGHKGIVHVRLRTRGIAAHSAYPEQGDSAIHKLLDVVTRLRRAKLPEDSVLGRSHLNVGTIRGGRAANVIADEAGAEVLLRTVTESGRYVRILEELVGDEAELEILKTSEPQEMESVEGFETKVVGYGTDIPALRPLGRPLLFGPGSILDAHTAHEKVAKQELIRAVDLYQKLVRGLWNAAALT